jgi:hypothetical protein
MLSGEMNFRGFTHRDSIVEPHAKRKPISDASDGIDRDSNQKPTRVDLFRPISSYHKDSANPEGINISFELFDWASAQPGEFRRKS